MKKTLLLLVALITATIAFAYDAEIDGIYYNLNDTNQTAEVTQLIEWSDTSNISYFQSNISIPEKITYNATEYNVTSIGKWTFSFCKSLTSITIPNSVTSIGEGAFFYCSRLTSITIPNSVTSIGERAFSWCSSLTSITIGNSITSIGNCAFDGCSSLSSVHISDIAAWCNIDFKDVGSNPLYYAKNLYLNGEEVTNLVIPEGVTSIRNYAFYYCSSLTSISIPNSVTTIGSSAFYGCKSLTSISIPNSVTSIGNSAFYRCQSLTSITIPNSVTSIGDYAFSGCESLDTLICNCNNDLSFDDSFILQKLTLRYLTAPAVVFNTFREEIQTQFSNKLTEMHISDGYLDENGFNFINRSKKFLHTIDLAGATNTTINDLAFYNYYKLENLTLPKKVETIGYKAFAECVLIKQLEIPATVTNIEERAFEKCRSINTLTFEEGSALESIGSSAFYNNHALESVELPEGVKEIGDAAFYGCNYVEEIVIPASVQRIGDNGFALCNQVKRMEVRATTPPAIEAKTFHQVSRDIEFIVPTEARNAYAEDEYWREFIQEVNNVENTIEGIEIYTQNGTLHLEGLTADYQIYNMSGLMVYSGNATTIDLAKGIYIIRINDKSQKIVL